MFKPKHLTSLCSEARQTQHSHASNQVLSEKVVGKSGSLVVIDISGISSNLVAVYSFPSPHFVNQ